MLPELVGQDQKGKEQVEDQENKMKLAAASLACHQIHLGLTHAAPFYTFVYSSRCHK